MKRPLTLSKTRYMLDARQLLCLYPLFLLLGKLVRWTLMRTTLIGYSKGWDYPALIMNGDWSFEFFGVEELSEGNIGQGGNIYTVLRVFWLLWLKLPTDFVSFEAAITLTWGLFLFLTLSGCRRYLSLGQGAYLALGVMVNSVYCFCLGKEVYQMLFFFLLYLVLRAGSLPVWLKGAAAAGVVLLSVTIFRTYYALILFFGGLFWGMMGLYARLRPGRRPSLPVFLALLAGMALGYLALLAALRLAMPALFFRFRDALLFASADTASSNTYMDNLLSGHGSNLLLITGEYLLAALRMMFPAELLRLGPKYWPYVLYQLLVSAGLLRAVRSWPESSGERRIATVLFAGFVFASATFEVDFGAWVRHGAVTMPLMLFLLDICRSKASPSTIQ